ncbi:MAG: DUF3048 domain-containing protein [Candidatus Berkelbacteria bacterium]|nr:DUF3048 domain-containing protein [Candidatus Berkelbacteria bacterium]
MSRRIKVLLIILGVVVVGAAIFYYFYFYKKGGASSIHLPKIGKSTETKKVECKLDGTQTTVDLANRHPLGIMIENHIDARPQTGLIDASIIYEAIAEGGITRLLAIYACHEPEKVGPVRSARTYYINWASEFNAFYVHVGGSADGLQKIKTDGILDLDQFKYGSQAFWREPQAGKATEHTMYTSTKKLWDIARKNKWDMTGNYENFSFKDDATTSSRPTSQTVTINFSSANYTVKWIYDSAANIYKRSQSKTPEIKTKNILIQWVNSSLITNSGGKQVQSMETIGSGKAKIIMDGKVTEGTWKKESRTSRTWFYDSTGVKIKLNRGQTWIEIVHNDTSVAVE